MSSDAGWPMWPPMPTTPPVVGRSPWWRRHKGWLGLGVLVVVAALAAGLLVRYGSRSSGPDRAPFAAALADLAAQPVIDYRTGLGSATADTQVTYAGDVLATVTVAGQKVSTMTVNGTTYVKMPNLLGSSGAKDPTGLAGKWITGSKAATESGTSAASSATNVRTPAALANRLYPGLNDKRTVLSTERNEANSVEGTPALKATTPDGELYVTRSEPYRLLRFVPKGAGSSPSRIPSLPSLPPMPTLPSGMPSLPSGFPSLPSGFPSFSLPALPSGLGLAADSAYRDPEPAARQARYATPPAGTLDFSRLSPEDVDTFYSRLKDATKELRTAVDADIDFTLKGKADLSCSSGGCNVVAHVTSNVTSSDPKAKITGGQVNATLTATVEVEGEQAGGCTVTRRLPLTGTSDIACDDVAAGPIFAEVQAEKKAEAEAEAEAEGRSVPYTVSSTGQAMVQAMAQVDVDALLLMEDLEQQILDDLQRPVAPGPTATGTPAPTGIPTVAPSRTPAASPSTAPSASPTAPPPDGKDKDKKKPTCVDRRPADAEDNGPDEGWTYYSPIGFKQRAFGAVVCLATDVTAGTGSNSNSPGMAEARAEAARLFPNSTERNLVNSCHLVPDVLGGRGITANLSPCWTKPINVPQMTRVADCVRPLMTSGIVQMTVLSRYSKNDDLTPYAFTYTVQAWDRQGNPVAQSCSRTIVNEKEEKLLNGHN